MFGMDFSGTTNQKWHGTGTTGISCQSQSISMEVNFHFYSQSGFQLSIVKPKLNNHSVQSERIHSDNPMNQSQLEANACSWHEEQENFC